MIAGDAGRGLGPELLRTSLSSMGKAETESKHRLEFVRNLLISTVGDDLTRVRSITSRSHIALPYLGQRRRAAPVGAKELKTIPVATSVGRHRDFRRIVLAR